MSDTRQIFTLKQVVSSIRKTIEERYHQAYWVKAEMHKLNRFPSGHAFPELVQKEDDRIVAQIGATIWSQNLQRIQKQFAEVVKEPLKEGTTLLMQVKIVFHENYGLSLQVLDIDPSYSLGELQKERQETLKRLQAEGILNTNQFLDFPRLPKRVAVISADQSKGLSDFMQVLDQNNRGYKLFTMLFPAYLQGDMAVASIQEQLRRIDRVKQHFDVVVIVRGGGGEVGMSCYNNFALCKAIATFHLPILTGIGHSTNMTVAEMVAFRNAITPTELADFLLEAFDAFAVPVANAREQILAGSKQLLENTQLRFGNETRLFKNAVRRCGDANKNTLLKLSDAYRSSTQGVVRRHRQLMDFSSKELTRAARLVIEQGKEGVKRVPETLKQRSNLTLVNALNLVHQKENLVRLMDPVNVLRRGYSITTVNGHTVNAASELEEGAVIKTQAFDVEIESTVIKKKTYGK
jgi:exodeoxyribonuclease VII large subunit